MLTSRGNAVAARIAIVCGVAWLALVGAAVAHAHATSDAHRAQATATPGKGYERQRMAVSPPAVTLRTHTGDSVRLDRLLAQPHPVLLQFIFTSCSTICPVMSAALSSAQNGFLEVDGATRLISISIDPEYDGLARLRGYAERHEAGDNWLFLTGGTDEIRQVIRAFDALYASNNKMYHRPYTYLRRSPADAWLRLTGMPGTGELLAEYRGLFQDERAPLDH